MQYEPMQYELYSQQNCFFNKIKKLKGCLYDCHPQ